MVELRYGRGIRVGHHAIELIMRELGIRGIPTRRLPKGARAAQVTSLDLVRRVFARYWPNALWVTDITEHPTNEGKVYCCVVLDTFSRLVAGWSIDSTQTTALATYDRPKDTTATLPRDFPSRRTCCCPAGCCNVANSAGIAALLLLR